MGAKNYRKKPVVVEAWQIDTLDYDEMCEILRWCGGQAVDEGEAVMAIPTLEGLMFAKGGDYIIRGVQGEFYPCKPDIFEATYETVDGEGLSALAAELEAMRRIDG
jgi:hypothetical protein